MRHATSMPPVRHETVCRATALLIATSACTVSHAQLCDNPIAYWKFDSGSLLDYSGHGNTLTNSGGTFPQGVVSNGLGLTTGHFAEAADAPSLNPTNAITVAAWYFPVAFMGTGNDPIVTKGFTRDAAPDYQYHLSVSDLDYASGLGGGRMGFGVAVNDVFVSAVSPAHAYQLGRWYFLVGTYDGASVRFFLNGALVDQHEYAGTLSAYGKPVRIGAFNNRTETLPGTIDEVHLYGRALSPDEIRVLYLHSDATPLVEPPARPACPTGSIAFSAKAVGIGPLTYEWQIATAGNTWLTLTGPPAALPCGGAAYASPANASQVTVGISPCPGSPGAAQHFRIRCVMTSACGSAISNEAVYTSCPANFSCSGTITVQDIFDFIAGWFAGDPRANFNGIGGIDIQDLFDFMTAWFAGCD